MTKTEAKTELKLLSSGTIATLTGKRTYDEVDAIINEKLELIDKVDVSNCKTWVDVWELLKQESLTT
jgi:hypothetical protein